MEKMERMKEVIDTLVDHLLENPSSVWKVQYKYQNGKIKTITLTLDIVESEDQEKEDYQAGQGSLPLTE